jgi:hypothetical protein
MGLRKHRVSYFWSGATSGSNLWYSPLRSLFGALTSLENQSRIGREEKYVHWLLFSILTIGLSQIGLSPLHFRAVYPWTLNRSYETTHLRDHREGLTGNWKVGSTSIDNDAVWLCCVLATGVLKRQVGRASSQWVQRRERLSRSEAIP